MAASNWTQHNQYLIQYSFNFQIGYNGCFSQTVVMKDVIICAIRYPITQQDMKLIRGGKQGKSPYNQNKYGVSTT